MKIRAKHLIFLLLTLSLMSCSGDSNKGGSTSDNKEPVEEPFIVDECDSVDSCSVNMFLINEDKYLLKIMPSGPCNNLTPANYLKCYDYLLKKNKDSLLSTRGFISIEYYNIKLDSQHIDAILTITNSVLPLRYKYTSSNQNELILSPSK